MTREEYLAIVSLKYDELQALNKIDNFYDYEKGFEKIKGDPDWKVLENDKTILENMVSIQKLPNEDKHHIMYSLDGLIQHAKTELACK